MRLLTTYQTTTVQQRNFDFFVFFSALYLVVSDILLTHTHTQALLTSKPTFLILSYARVKRGVTLVNKGLLGVSFVRFFVSISGCFKNENKARLTTRFTFGRIYTSLMIVCFFSLISQAGGIHLPSACKECKLFKRIFISSASCLSLFSSKNEENKSHT